MELGWITDPHFDFIKHQNIVAFAKHINNLKMDAVVITGDISNGRDLSRNLRTFAGFYRNPIYFLCGNHDYYYSSLALTTEVIHECCSEFSNLIFLDEAGVIELTGDTALVGNSGFFDCKAGDPNSEFQMSDFTLNMVLKRSKIGIRNTCREIAESMAPVARLALKNAANLYKNVYFATHVPPFTESCWYQGKPSEPYALPWFTNLTFGMMLTDVAEAYPDVNFTVLCGHTHGAGEYQHLPNLKVYTGAAEYEYPAIWKIISL